MLGRYFLARQNASPNRLVLPKDEDVKSYGTPLEAPSDDSLEERANLAAQIVRARMPFLSDKEIAHRAASPSLMDLPSGFLRNCLETAKKQGPINKVTREEWTNHS